MYFVKTPWWLKKFYPQLIWNKARTTKTIFLTFDDGPIPIVTPWVIKTLKSFNAKATFFCIGDNIQKHYAIFLQLKADGHAIGNHTYNHLKGWATADDVYVNNFNKCQTLTQTNLFRPPYGRIKRSQIREIQNLKFKIQNQESKNSKIKNQKLNQQLTTNYSPLSTNHSLVPTTTNFPLATNHLPLPNQKIIMWDVLSGDFDIKLSPEICLKHVLKHTENGSIVVFHDSLKAWDRLEYVLPKALAYWQKLGFKFEVIT